MEIIIFAASKARISQEEIIKGRERKTETRGGREESYRGRFVTATLIIRLQNMCVSGFVCLFDSLLNIHGKHLRSCQDCQVS